MLTANANEFNAAARTGSRHTLQPFADVLGRIEAREQAMERLIDARMIDEFGNGKDRSTCRTRQHAQRLVDVNRQHQRFDGCNALLKRDQRRISRRP
jgi:hypothetical protein